VRIKLLLQEWLLRIHIRVYSSISSYQALILKRNVNNSEVSYKKFTIILNININPNKFITDIKCSLTLFTGIVQDISG